ncbi:MAG: NAD-dependent epimerase/dehydratase family protein [Culturomica sp.]|jgi:nucleoside-diphosphate-sugar epimerase|nr:NAD-dependent epimerase/dehydratase family protein [Culturomica sp.]
MEQKTVLVTGADSLLGTHVIRCLLECRYRVRGMTRHPHKFRLKPQCRLELVKGNIHDPHSFSRHLKGCDQVIHISPGTSRNLLRYADYYAEHVRSAHLLVQQSIRYRIKRFVYVGATCCFGFGSREKPGDESRTPGKPFSASHYAKSKQEAQDLVLHYRKKIEVVVVNPACMLGPYDQEPASGRILLRGYRKKWIFHPPGGKNFIPATDAAGGVVKALQKGKNGESYLLCGENLSYRELFEKLSHTTGNIPRYVQIPRPLLVGIGMLGDVIRFFGIANSFTLHRMRLLCTHRFYASHKAAAELEWQPTPVEPAIREAIHWFEHNSLFVGKNYSKKRGVRY